MFCKNCGNKISQDADFCKKCGNTTKEGSKNITTETGIVSADNKKFSFGKTFFCSAVSIALVLLIFYGLMGEFEKDATGTFVGVIILSALLGVLATFVIKVFRGEKRKNGSELTPEDIAKFRGLNGWLILVIFGLFLTAGYCGYQFLDIFFNNSQYVGMSNMFLYDFLSLGTITLLSVYTIYLFFGKKKKFAKYYISMWILLILVNVITLIILSSYSVAGDDFDEYLINTIRAIFGAIIWGSYAVKSKRVKATFVND